MDILELMEQRHSVRQYVNKPIEADKRQILVTFVEACNQTSGLHFQLVFDEPECFNSAMARYGKFEGVRNYIVVAGKKSKDLEQRCGYYGEKLVLKAQELGLSTCWVAMSYGKKKCVGHLEPGEKRVCVIALGYGKNQGVAHRSKPMDEVCRYAGTMPDWFEKGVKAACLAPTAMNQQKFMIDLQDGKAVAYCGSGFYAKFDFGIVRYSFKAASGHVLKAGR